MLPLLNADVIISYVKVVKDHFSFTVGCSNTVYFTGCVNSISSYAKNRVICYKCVDIVYIFSK